MTLQQKQYLKHFLFALIVTNTLAFLVMAYFHLLSTDPKSAVFIDFWGRFTVYSLWFIGFTLYAKYLANMPLIRGIILGVVCLNIPLFLGLAYFDKIANTPDMIVFVDFWGRITVYSLWVICFEAYCKYIEIELSNEKNE